VDSTRHRLRAFAVGGALLLTGSGAAPAVDFRPVSSSPPIVTAQLTPPADIPGDNAGDRDAAQLLLRIDRLESELRQANGQIEELQNQQRRLEDQLKRFQEDVEFRFRNLGQAGQGVAVAPPPGPEPTPLPTKTAKKADAFDPDANPNAPGAPQPLGSTAPSAPLPRQTTASAGPTGLPMPLIRPAPVDPGPTVITANTGIDTVDAPRQEFNAALDAYRAGDYAKAEEGFKAFLAANPAHRLSAEAIFFLGETYLQRSRPREAAEEYLKVSTDYAKSSRAPMAMVRLGQSLAMLGNTEQACGAYAEVGKRYPTADVAVKKMVEREQERDHC